MSVGVLVPWLERGGIESGRLVGLILPGGADSLAAVVDRLSPGGTSSGKCQTPVTLDRPALPDSIDALHYDIDIEDVDEAALTFRATTTVTLEALNGLSAVDLNLTAVEVDSVEVRAPGPGGFVPGVAVQADSILHLEGFPPLDPGDTLRVRVHYRGSDPTCFNNGGYASGFAFTDYGVHSFSEPEFARRWYPCHDVPRDKATFTIAVTEPSGRVASAAGDLVDSTMVDGKVKKTWAVDRPIATYLAAFYLADYVKLEDVAPNGVRLEYFTYPELVDKTRTEFQSIPDMVEFFSGFYPYPGPRYAMSLGYFPGGMEHEWNSLIGWFYIRGDGVYETLFSHELAHQWWGDLVTLADWRDLWLNEGFATYFEYLYTEHRYGWTAMRAVTAKVDSVYIARLDMLDHPVLDPPADWPFTFTVYKKGGRVLDMLRGVSRLRLMTGAARPPEEWNSAELAGDERFFRIFSQYAQDHHDGIVTTADFRGAAEAQLGEDLGWFFDPWLTGTGFPDLDIHWSLTTSERGTQVAVEVSQVQPGTRFHMPVQVRYRDGDRLLDEVREIDGMVTTWETDLPRGDWSVELDPDDWLLDRQVREAPVPLAEPLRVAPNPSRSGFDFTAVLAGPEATPVTLAVYDLQGKPVRTWRLGNLPAGNFREHWDGRTDQGKPAAAGVYLARVSIARAVTVRRLVLLR